MGVLHGSEKRDEVSSVSSCQRRQKGEEIGLFLRRDIDLHDRSALQRARRAVAGVRPRRDLAAAGRIDVDHLFQNRRRLIVHIRAGHGNVPQPRRAELAHVLAIAGNVEQAAVPLRIGALAVTETRARWPCA
jgi:hypothetical protein